MCSLKPKMNARSHCLDDSASYVGIRFQHMSYLFSLDALLPTTRIMHSRKLKISARISLLGQYGKLFGIRSLHLSYLFLLTLLSSRYKDYAFS